MDKKGQAAGVMTFLMFAVMVIITVVIFSNFDTVATSSVASTTAASQARANVTANTYSAFNLVAVGPIIFGAVVVLGIVGMLYKQGG